MAYSDGEALFLTRLRAMSQFTTHNSSRGKWGILNTGEAKQYAVLKAGTRARVKSIKTVQETHRTIIQLWQRYIDDGTSYTDLMTLVDAVVAELDKYRTMGDTGDTVVKANIVEVGEVATSPSPEAPYWLIVEVVGEWVEHHEITYA